MGKEEGDLWDDSALINAFDDAISKYKKMHARGTNESQEGGKVNSNTEPRIDESYEAKRHMEAGDNSDVESGQMTEVGERTTQTLKENLSLDSCAPEKYMSSSNGQHVQNVDKNFSNTQGTEDYNNLLNQYYALEEQRQKVLEQLYQFGSWNEQGSGFNSNLQWGTSTSQGHQMPVTQSSCPNVASCCFSCVCPCLATPCTSLPNCASGTTYTGKTCGATSGIDDGGKSFSVEDCNLIKTAMGAAEKALSSLEAKGSAISDLNKENEKHREANVGQLAPNNSSETDLTVVLNAWYSAGFYTGKYLTERSIAKK